MSGHSNFLSYGSGGANCGFVLCESGEPFELNPGKPPGDDQQALRFLGKTMRTILKAIGVSVVLFRASMEFVICVGMQSDKTDTARRTWMKRTARRLLKAMAVEVRVEGVPPSSGLLVSNHLGYLDILVLASVIPAIFVSKAEVRSWPVFGWLAQCAGTIFVKRESRGDVGRVSQEIGETLARGAVAILFPEGTSSNGETVRPFRSSLLEPALRLNCPVSPAALDYTLAEGSVGQEVCYWGDMVLGPHLLNLLSKPGVQATVRFGNPEVRATVDRKQLAKNLRESVCLLRGEETPLPESSELCAS